MAVCLSLTPADVACAVGCTATTHSAGCRLMIEEPPRHLPDHRPRAQIKVQHVDLCVPAQRLSLSRSDDLIRIAICKAIYGRRVSNGQSSSEGTSASGSRRVQLPPLRSGSQRSSGPLAPRARPGTADPSEPLVERTRNVGRASRSYRLEIVQHPLKAAEFGTSTLTRLPLAPPVIAQLYLRDLSAPEDMNENDLPFLIAHLTLYSEDGSRALDVVGPGGQTPSQQLLYGNLVSSPHTLRNLQGRQGIYFLFPDVSIRWAGRYQLSVTLMRIEPTSPGGQQGQGTVLAHTRTLPFDVCARSDYRAPAQTPLTQYFLQQGARMTTTSTRP